MKKILCCLMVLCICLQSYACSVCGSSAGNQYLGLLPQTFKNFVGFQYQSRGFTSEHPGHGEHSASQFSREQYNTYQIWGRYYIGRRIQVLAFVPFVSNKMNTGSQVTKVNGLGDITLLVNVNLIRSSNSSDWKHQLQAGVGVKLPTGAYDQRAINTGNGLPNMQPGTRSWDVSFNSNYTIRKDKLGFNVDAAYTLTSPNDIAYKFGNKSSIALLGFYQVTKKSITLLPQVGAKLDLAARDYDNYNYKWKNDMTGGKQVYALAGAQAYYDRFGFQVTYHQPFYQHFASGLVNARYKLETGLFYLF